MTGSIEHPAATGEKPAATWSSTTSRKNTTPIAAYMISVTTLTAVNSREANTRTGTSGDTGPPRERRASSTTNAAPSATPATAATTGTGEPRSMSPYVTPASARAASAAPSTSNRPVVVSSRVSGTCRTAVAITRAAMGRLIRKTQRQPAVSTSQPPSRGPIAPATPPRPDQAPTARGRSSRTKDDWMIAREPGVRSAPPMPCSARARTSVSMLGASPHRAEATANHPTPMTKILRLPYRSPRDPPSRIRPASVRV